ncbi:hypothetical protein UFOVP71_364 [uncultured Caudovirales phage]|uniref:Uncharacterized protein n=1 Tax=uncultured Caudovirales phage TaxID=2100421 RepID=A0A6J5TA80_9CAUD|nr:hypothetical protein UFOVP71_364 [uncultured Caudovirales phage]
MTRVTQMIRIQLVREGQIVKQITSRVHESVVLEQINKFKDAYDEIVIVEGDLSEDARGMLKHVARKVVPAALAAGMALGSHGAAADNRSQNYGNNGTPGINRDFPSLNYSPGQYLQQAVLNARSGGAISKQPGPQVQYQQSPQQGTATKVYDQSRVSQDGRFYIVYDMDNKITRVPVQGTDFMAGDSQRMPHYITANGQVMYVRHPHNNGLGENIKKITESAMGELYSELGDIYHSMAPGIEKYKDSFKANQLYDALEKRAEELGAHREFTRMMGGAKNSAHMEYDTNPRGFENWFWFLPFAEDDVSEGMGTIGTTPTIPTSGSSNNNMSQKTQFNPTGKTTNATFNANGQLEIDDEDKQGLSPQAVDALKKAGIQIEEGVDEGLQAILSQYADSYAEFKEGGDIEDNQDFYDALYTYFADEVHEMPYGVQKARDGDPYAWITDRLNSLDNAPVVEADDEASAADQGAADKNIIMQIRKASDYEKPYALELGDGNSITITAQTANKILSQFDKLKPQSKELMQQTLNSAEGFREMLNYFNEREVNEADISINEQARIRARLLIKGVFGV